MDSKKWFQNKDAEEIIQCIVRSFWLGNPDTNKKYTPILVKFKTATEVAVMCSRKANDAVHEYNVSVYLLI